MDPPPPSEPAAFKDLGEPSSPESRLHMLYVPNARGGSRSWTGRVETWLEGSYRNRTAGIDDRNPVRGSGFFPTPFLFYFEFFDSFDFFLFFSNIVSNALNYSKSFLFFFFIEIERVRKRSIRFFLQSRIVLYLEESSKFYRNWKGEKKVDAFVSFRDLARSLNCLLLVNGKMNERFLMLSSFHEWDLFNYSTIYKL